VHRLAFAGHPLHVGCAVGADAIAIQACLLHPGARLSVFAVGLPSGFGFWSGSALPVVRKAAAAGVPVRWAAGGHPGRVPLVPRLMARSVAGFQGCALSLFFSPGRGSSAVAVRSLRVGIPVILFCAFPPELSYRGQVWLPVASQFMGSPCWFFPAH
jgi:hypothetical protein